jgi:hypothetical protein
MVSSQNELDIVFELTIVEVNEDLFWRELATSARNWQACAT